MTAKIPLQLPSRQKAVINSKLLFDFIIGFFAVIYRCREFDDMKLEQIMLYYSQNLNP